MTARDELSRIRTGGPRWMRKGSGLLLLCCFPFVVTCCGGPNRRANPLPLAPSNAPSATQVTCTPVAYHSASASASSGQPPPQPPQCSERRRKAESRLCGAPIAVPAACLAGLAHLARGEVAGIVSDFDSCALESPTIARYGILRRERHKFSVEDYTSELEKIAALAKAEGLGWLSAIAHRDIAVAIAIGPRADAHRVLDTMMSSCRDLGPIPLRQLPTELGTHPCELVGAVGAGRPAGGGQEAMTMYLEWIAAASACEERCPPVP